MSEADHILLIGGPFDGEWITAPDGRWTPIILTGDRVPEGMVARYKPTRDKCLWRFSEWDRIVGTLPLPGAVAA